MLIIAFCRVLEVQSLKHLLQFIDFISWYITATTISLVWGKISIFMKAATLVYPHSALWEVNEI